MSKGRRTEKRKRLRARRLAAGHARSALRQALCAYALKCPGLAADREGFSRHITRMLSAWISEGLTSPEAEGDDSAQGRQAQEKTGSQSFPPSGNAAQLSIKVPTHRPGAPRHVPSGEAERHLVGNALPGNPVVVLFRPEIPPNAGTIARLCAAFRLKLVLIGPLGFDVTEKAFRRAGLDYWPWVDLDFFADWQSFRQSPEYAGARMVFVETTGPESVHAFAFQSGDLLVFGSETSGLPGWLLSGADGEQSADEARPCREYGSQAVVRIPMPQPHVRSINLANSVAIVTSHALGQLRRGSGLLST